MQIQGSNSVASQMIKAQENASKTDSEVAVAIAKKGLDVQKQQGAALVQMIQQAAGRGIDIKA